MMNTASRTSAGLAADVRLNARLRNIGFLLAAANVVVWAWAWLGLRTQSELLGTAVLAYTFGLRHGLDADHIAAIDNVTRKLMQDGKRPAAVGFFFALGHSLVVLLASILVAYAARSFSAWLPIAQEYGSLLSTAVSSSFLLLIGLFNIFVFADLYRASRRARRGIQASEDESRVKGNLLARLCMPAFNKITHSAQMIPLGFLFGLGFETATEVSLLTTSAIHAAQGTGLATVLLFPALFTVGMLTVDAADGILMVRVYGWALACPVRKLSYNMGLTFLSMLLAFIIATLGLVGLAQDHLDLKGGLWHAIPTIQQHYMTLGVIIVSVFLSTWLVSKMTDRIRGGGGSEA